MEIPEYHETKGVIERNIGAFGGWLAPNDWLPDWYMSRQRAPGIMHCGIGNGACTIYHDWNNMLSWNAGQLNVNLLMNRASKWADVHSHVQYSGRVDANLKEPVALSVRLLEWVDTNVHGAVTCRVDDQPQQVRTDGRYALVGKVEAGATVTVQSPMRQRDELIDVEKRTNRILLRGNTMRGDRPPGRECGPYSAATTCSMTPRAGALSNASWPTASSRGDGRGRSSVAPISDRVFHLLGPDTLP